MTCREIGEYVEQQQIREKNNALLTSSTGYRLAEMLIVSNSMCVKNPKIMKFEDLFPELKDNVSKEETILNTWKEFLGVR